MTGQSKQVKSAQSKQERFDEQASLEAAVSEGWPVLRQNQSTENPDPRSPYRTGSQTWLRRRAAKVQPIVATTDANSVRPPAKKD